MIGNRVFGRPTDYDPTSDNIVRVEATQLRKRLDLYFADEGASEPYIIRVPKGRYVPVFEPAPKAFEPAPAAVIDPPPPASLPEPPPAAPLRPGDQNRNYIAWLAVLVLVVLGADIYLRARASPSPLGPKSGDHISPVFTGFWSHFFAARPLLFCVADSNLSLLQDLRDESISLTEYTSGRYLETLRSKPPKSDSDRIQASIASRYYTSLGDATAMMRLMSVNWEQSPVAVRFARDLNIRDLRSGNVVLFGSAHSNPWIELLDRKLRFHIEHDLRANRPVLRDSRPEPGKPDFYLCGVQSDKPYESYGIAAVVPNLNRTGHAILIAGSNMQGTEAAAEFLTNPASLSEFLRRINWKPGGPLPVFQVVLKLVTIGGSPSSSHIFAYSVENQ